MTDLAGGLNRTAVRFHDGLRDGEAHAGSGHSVALALSTKELPENLSELSLLDSWPYIELIFGEKY